MFTENTEELAQNKLLLLFIINKSKKPLTNEEITEFILENNYMNYFLIQQYLSELVESNFIKQIDKEGKKVYILLDKGKSTLSYFEDRLNPKIKDEISSKFNNVKDNPVKTTQVLGEFFKKGEYQYIVNLKLIENNEALFSLYLNVANTKQAEEICQIWKDNTEFIYKNILNILTNNSMNLL
ncbi:MAG: DUF4364 family protein [Tissierellia bacterium]|nr:DUF4364 family protein [Tissierellia bacterium]